MRELFVPLAAKLVEIKFGLAPYYAHFTPPIFRQTGSHDKLDTRNHGSGGIPQAMVHHDYDFGSYELMTGTSDIYFTIPNPQKTRRVQQKFQKAGRVMGLQFWMSALPEGNVIENETLALCHPQSIQPSDLVSRRITWYNGYKANFKILHAKDSRSHEWFYRPGLATDESLVWVGYDSAWGEELKPCFHTSFHDSTLSTNGRPRESVECRVVLLLDEKIPCPLPFVI